MRHSYSLETDILPIIKGEIPVPNPEFIEKDVGAAILHYREMRSGIAVLPGRKVWNVRYFLDYGQGGGLQGSGLIAWTDWKVDAYRAVGVTFAICRHTPVTGAGANPSRGWHPASCSKCGLDLSVDSGD